MDKQTFPSEKYTESQQAYCVLAMETMGCSGNCRTSDHRADWHAEVPLGDSRIADAN